MEYGSSETILTMLKAMAIGLAAGYVIWGWKRKPEPGAAAPQEPAASPPEPEEPAAAPKAARPAPPPPSRPVADPVADPVAEPASEPQPESVKPAGLFSAPPDRIDDLQKIRGVGPKMAGLLNERGIYQYAQLASLSPAEIAWLDAALEVFPGRIARDDWVAQARALMKEGGSAP